MAQEIHDIIIPTEMKYGEQECIEFSLICHKDCVRDTEEENTIQLILTLY